MLSECSALAGFLCLVIMIAIGVHEFLMISDVWGSPLVGGLNLIAGGTGAKKARSRFLWLMWAVIHTNGHRGNTTFTLFIENIWRLWNQDPWVRQSLLLNLAILEQLCKISLLVALSQCFPRIHPAADRHTRSHRGRPRLERFFDHAYCPSTVPGLKNATARHLGIRHPRLFFNTWTPWILSAYARFGCW